MSNFDLQSSKTYQTIANLLRHIESLDFPKSSWCIYDGGQTLELTTELYNQISQTAEFQDERVHRRSLLDRGQQPLST